MAVYGVAKQNALIDCPEIMKIRESSLGKIILIGAKAKEGSDT